MHLEDIYKKDLVITSKRLKTTPRHCLWIQSQMQIHYEEEPIATER